MTDTQTHGRPADADVIPPSLRARPVEQGLGEPVRASRPHAGPRRRPYLALGGHAGNHAVGRRCLLAHGRRAPCPADDRSQGALCGRGGHGRPGQRDDAIAETRRTGAPASPYDECTYGIAPSDIHWVRGEIDALVAPRAPSSFARGAPNIGWLFEDPIATAGDYFARTGIFPIIHVLGIRRELAEAYPFLPVAIYRAFEQARAIAVGRLSDVTALRTSFPSSEVHIKQTRALMGQDFWSYGVTPANRKVLDAFLTYHHGQGPSPRRPGVEKLLHPSTYELKI